MKKLSLEGYGLKTFWRWLALDFEELYTEIYECEAVTIYKHKTLGEDFGNLIAEYRGKYYLISIEGWNPRDYEAGCLCEIII